MLSQMPGVDQVDAYIITVKNTGMRPVTIKNIYLHFGDKKQGDIFVGTLNIANIHTQIPATSGTGRIL
jgi:hypothetical protein